MNGAFYIGATGLRSQERALEAAANNVTNVNTPGYKRVEVRFAELVGPAPAEIDQALGGGAGGPSLAGVAATTADRVFAQGDLRTTGQPLDLAIQGNGFLELLGRDGRTLLWRGGTLKVNEDGFLATAGGLPLRGMIAVPQGAGPLTIAQDGTVTATVDGEAMELGRIDLAIAKDLSRLSAIGEGVYEAADPADVIAVRPGEEGGGMLVQGAVEGSNVSMSDEMVTLLMMQRGYAANAQIVQAGDQLMAIANGLRR